MTQGLDPLRNAKDPLHKSGPDAARELFRHMGQLASGFPQEAVLDAATNVMINVIRQQQASWPTAEAFYDQLFGRVKTILRDHYDANGRRRNVFPFDQVILADHFTDADGFKRK